METIPRRKPLNRLNMTCRAEAAEGPIYSNNSLAFEP